ncbi:unnamed protein product [Arctogadus glacialis]
MYISVRETLSDMAPCSDCVCVCVCVCVCEFVLECMSALTIKVSPNGLITGNISMPYTGTEKNSLNHVHACTHTHTQTHTYTHKQTTLLNSGSMEECRCSPSCCNKLINSGITRANYCKS